MKNETIIKNKRLVNHRNKTSYPKVLPGKTSDKYPVILDGGKTVIFISDKSKEAETRQRYEMHRDHSPVKSHS
jgi:hypothetical protein